MTKQDVSFLQSGKVGDPDHKPCSEAFAGQPWYVIQTNPRYEFVCAKDLARLPFPVDTYVASQSDVHHYRNGSKRTVQHLVITKRVFVRFPEGQRQRLLTDSPFALRYMMDPAMRLNPHGGRQFARVPDVQIQKLRELLAEADAPVEYADLSAYVGEEVRVVSGGLIGQEGKVYSENGKTYLILSLDALGTFKVQISPTHLHLKKKS